MNEVIFSVGTTLLSFLLPVGLAKIFSRRNSEGRLYNPENGQYLNRIKRFIIFISTALVSFFLIEPLIDMTLHGLCLQNPYAEWIILFIGIIANYVLIDYIS